MLIERDLLIALVDGIELNHQDKINGAKEEIRKYLSNNFTLNQIIDDYIDVTLKCRMDNIKVEVTSEELEIINKSINQIFRVKGYKADGTPETRGRKKKNTELL